MVNLRHGFVLMLFAAVSSVAGAQGRWESASNVGQESTGDAMLTRCSYQTIGGYRFTTISRGICPFSVEINPETGKVKTPANSYSSSQSRAERATLKGQHSSSDPMWQTCVYETVGGYRFSTNQRGVCPFGVDVNPESGNVTVPNEGYGANGGSTGSWESATKTGQDHAGDGLLWRCSYKTLGGYRFTTTSRDLCKFSVEVNPVTREVR